MMKMTFKEWLTYDFPSEELIFWASGYKLLKFLGLPQSGGDPPVAHPIGLSSYYGGGVSENLDYSSLNSQSCYCNFKKWCAAGGKRRNKYTQNLYSLDFVTQEGKTIAAKKEVTIFAYSQSLINHRFCICPEGNGEDSHRHYEALIMKSIPIITNPDSVYCMKRWGLPSQIKEKYTDLPVLYTEDYTEISPEYLETQYRKILNTVYNFQKLTLSYWKDKSFILTCQYQRLLTNGNKDPVFSLHRSTPSKKIPWEPYPT